MEKERACGVIGLPSIRTFDYNVVCGSNNIELPKSYILPEDRIPKVTNQGSISACCAYATAEILNILNKIEFKEDELFSEGFIYGYNRNTQATYMGMNPENLIYFLCKRGSVPKKYYNEICEMPDMQKKILEDPNLKTLEKIAEKYKLKGYVGFLKGNKDDMKKALYDAEYPLFAVSSRYFGGSHAIIIIGWDENGFIIQNSWGEEWGDKGRKTVPLSAISYAYLFLDEVIELKFKDVKETDWYYNAVKECVFNGLMQGISDTEFEPNRQLTRAEAAQLMSNIMKKVDEVLKLNENNR